MLTDQTRFLVFALGIFFCYFGFGIIQEKITRGRYGDEKNIDGTIGERYTFILALVWVQCLCNWLFAKCLLIVKPQKDDTTHYGYYATSSLTYLLAMVGSNMALRWVTYPTQVVGKSAKPIPVMLLGVLIGRKTYSLLRYICVFIIVAGVVLFMYKEGNKVNNLDQEKTGIGELLLILSLLLDGLTGAVQDRMRAAHAPSGQQMMLAMNWWSTIMLGPALILTGEGMNFIGFAIKYPNLLIHLALLSLAGAFGQLFIFLMVSCYGPLACSVVTTTRKFFTVLCSVILFGNILNGRQWFGATLVFAALFVDMFYGKNPSSSSTSLASSKKQHQQPQISKHDEENKKLSS